MDRWDGRLLWGEGQIEPLFVWILALLFKIFGPSLELLRMIPAFCSVLTVLLGYAALRQFFPRSLSILFSAFAAFQFWSLIYARLCITEDLVFPLMALVFLFLGRVLRSGPGARERWLFLLGLTVGIGAWSYTAWGALVLGMSCFVAWEYGWKKRMFLSLACYFTPMILILLPLLGARLTPAGMAYIGSIFSPGHLAQGLAKYLIGLFWYGFGTVPYGPAWGGMLNSVMGSLALTGSLELFSQKRYGWLGGLVGSILLGLLPGILASGMDMNRIQLAFPAVMLLAFWGSLSLIPERMGTWRWAGFVGWVLLSGALDLYHYTGPYVDTSVLPEDKKQWRSVEYANAYRYLKERSRSEGPLYVMNDLNLDYDNKTLDLACYPFDAEQNKNLSGSRVKTLALLTNLYYSPFLKARFPGSQWIWLKSGTQYFQSNFCLGFIPVSGFTDGSLDEWQKALSVFHRANIESKNKTLSVHWDDIAMELSSSGRFFFRDPFLRSVLWERVAMYELSDQHYSRAVEAYRKSIQEGYPARHLFWNMGLALEEEGKTDDAKAAFEKAKKPSPHHRFISEDLSFVQR
ncbi:MAG TPA: glycosyltransferase family 39 protein [bacterium]|nr:glycosyltransferase family 39 protein [bacterium]